MSTDWVLNDLQWFVLAGLLDNPDLSERCSAFWFADKPRRMDMFNALTKFTDGPVGLCDLYWQCKAVSPFQIAALSDSPRPYRKKLERMISDLGEHVKRTQKVVVVRG